MIKLDLKTIEKIAQLILLFIICFILFYFFVLGSLPAVDCFYAKDIIETAIIRQNIIYKETSLLSYGSGFIIRALIPFFLFYFYKCKSWKSFFVILFFSVFFTFNLLQKSYISFICLPLMVYLFYLKRWKHFFLFLSISLLGFVFLVLLTNPELRKTNILNKKQYGVDAHLTDSIHFQKKSRLPIFKRILIKGTVVSNAIYSRVMLTPGKVVSEWFSLIPNKYPFLYGKGYHFLYFDSFIDYSRILYDELFPEYKLQGIKGSVNVASFVYEYSNFGKLGLVVSGLLMALMFYLVEIIFDSRNIYMLVFNILPVTLLSSAALSTTLFSGGWGLTILLFLFFKKKLTS